MSTPQSTVAYKQQWEYHTHVVAKTLFGGKMKTEVIQQSIAKFGMDGWELVSTLYDVNIAGARDGLLLLFKRPVIAAPTA